MKHCKKPATPRILNCYRRKWITNFKKLMCTKTNLRNKVITRKEKQKLIRLLCVSISQTSFTRKEWQSDTDGNQKVKVKRSYRKDTPYSHTSQFMHVLFLNKIFKGNINLVDCLKDILFEEKPEKSTENSTENLKKSTAKGGADSVAKRKTDSAITHSRRTDAESSHPQRSDKSPDKLYCSKERPACSLTQGPEQSSTVKTLPDPIRKGTFNDKPINKYKHLTDPSKNKTYCSNKIEGRSHNLQKTETIPAQRLHSSDRSKRTDTIPPKHQNLDKKSYNTTSPVSRSVRANKTNSCDKFLDTTHPHTKKTEKSRAHEKNIDKKCLGNKTSTNSIRASKYNGNRKGNDNHRELHEKKQVSKNKERTRNSASSSVKKYTEENKLKYTEKETNSFSNDSNKLKNMIIGILFDPVIDSDNDSDAITKRKDQHHSGKTKTEAKKTGVNISEANLKNYTVENSISKHKHGFIFPEITSSVMRAKRVDDDDEYIECNPPRKCTVVKEKKQKKKKQTCTEPKKKEKKKKKLPPCQEEIVVCRREKPPCQKDIEEEDKLCEIPECKRAMLEKLFEDCFEKTEGQCGVKPCCLMPSCKKEQMRKLLIPCDSDSISGGSITNEITCTNQPYDCETQTKSNNNDNEPPCGCDQIKQLQSQMEMLQKFVQCKLEESMSHIIQATKERKPTPCKYLGNNAAQDASATQTSEYAINDPNKCPPSCVTVPEAPPKLECVDDCPAKPKVKKSYCQLKREEEKTSQVGKSFCAQKRGGSKVPCDANCDCSSKEAKGLCEDDCPSKPPIKANPITKVSQTDEKRKNVTTFTPASSQRQKSTDNSERLQLRRKESPTYVQKHTDFFGTDRGSRRSSYSRLSHGAQSPGASSVQSQRQYDSGNSSRTSFSTIDKVQNILGSNFGAEP